MSYILSKDNFENLQEFIYRKSGIYLDKDKHYEKLAKYIEKRALLLDIDSFKKYFYKLRFDDFNTQEFQSLINYITVNETYFYRENNQFETLVNHVLPEFENKLDKSKPIRILSSPCSSGEEPYSILLHIIQKYPLHYTRDIEIVGIDIDSMIIDKAKKGFFSERSVQSIPKEVLNAWFEKIDIGYKISDRLSNKVQFKVVNVFDKNQMLELGKFDIIFSRNMLIYFDDASRKEVVMTFYNMLNENGCIFLGHAENMNRIVSVFNSKKINHTLVYTK
ncbi:protein-glutamate O-methyltransferase CheR [Sulfurimonas lithotrophica]|uniref:protein-glutamate O-methyltransferase n=1 Tax=Sulfurimonas lithotrophica TaxID=2590022 RepID=A0A5P8P1Y8_9BACT|nr:CheR family methyltransferase [Sulfurimonas lithotrophica]QFR49694.1 protein-glutamate O-methyltransferase CheR [Sulfurimonas lithotrophica]